MSVSVKITGSIKGLKAALDDGVTKVKSFGQTVKGIATSVNSAFALLGAGFAFKGMVDNLDSLSKRSRSLGLTAEELQGIEYAARSANAPLEMINSSFGKIAKTITDAKAGNKQAVDTLLKLGLTAESFAGKSTYQAFDLIVKSISDIPDATMRSAVAISVFGEEASKSMAFFSDFQQNVENFKDNGQIIDDSSVMAAEELNQALLDIIKSLEAMSARTGFIQVIARMLSDIAGATSFTERVERSARRIELRKQGLDPDKVEAEEKEKANAERRARWAEERRKRIEEAQRIREEARAQMQAKAQAEAEAKAKAEADKAAKAKSSPIKEAVQKAMEVGGTEVNASSLARIGGGYGRLDAYQSTMQNAIKSMKTNTETMASAVADIKANGISLRA